MRTGKGALAGATALVLGVGLAAALPQAASAAPVGQGFNLNTSDLKFILKQIKISEAHAAGGVLRGPGANQVNSAILPHGLRTVDGTLNNLQPGQSKFGAADTPFPRLLTGDFRAAEEGTSYANPGTVRDSVPRTVSNLIVDQTATNPAAVEAAGPNPPTEGNTLFIPNKAPDTGLSAPYNSWFTLFGQFFDHGLDLTGKGSGSVFVPLKPGDPLYTEGSPTNFMVLSRATVDGNKNANNSTSAFVDQSQTYTSHPSHQVFLREYVSGAGGPVTTGKLLTGPDGGLATWGSVKAQALSLLGIVLTDTDALNVPLLATDPYGRYTRGTNGFPQVVTATGLVEGTATGLALPANTTRTGHAFLDDIAHHAAPGGTKTPDTDPGTADDNNPATYDDEMLARHFTAGDGRANENIGLSTVHHIFHSEHNRLNGDISTLLATDAALQTDWNNAPSGTGERLFQAAKFVTEMEYQHLAFEEFARKVQPQVNLFGSYHSEIDPAITAEFAHVVYRFGHSMLNQTVERKNADGSNNDVALLDAFLDPVEYVNGGSAGTLSPEQAAGSVVRGMTNQVGNELDEFVTDTLRNSLLGLPLDLATLNMARGRETGVPSLNNARKKFFASTNDAALQPYQGWTDFGLSIKHPKSLVNFLAAYGKHPSITAATTPAGKRAAAELLIKNDPTAVPASPADSGDFMAATGTWTTANSGLDDVDFWVGGLAEKQMPFGGLLGNTFNFVFETQMENLQDGDRFYYLTRTAGLNLLTQLEGNSFAELIMRNTDVSGLPADSFSRPDYVFDVAKLGTTGPILDDPATTYNESTLLTRTADGTIRYAGAAHVVFNGAPGDNKIWSSEGDDTIRGDAGKDRAEGGAGNDNLIGGLGDDILTDSFGDDVIKGGDDDDAISSGQGFDLNQGGLGKDFVVGGSDPTETFGGPGDDFIFAGQSADTVFGDDGDDWIEGGNQNDLLQGDNGAPFQDDPNLPGGDVIIGGGGDDDYDAEGGDDIMVAGPGIERNEGTLGFDWSTHKGDPQAADSDMDFTGLLPPTLENNRDRYDLVEGLSGWDKDDILRGDSADVTTMVGHELTDAAAIARINGLASQLPAGATSFTGGNILLGGAGSDIIEGRGGDDVINGDAWLDVQLQATVAGVTKTVDNMAALQADVFAGRLDPGTITTVRSIVTATPGTSVDTAVFTGPRADYDVSNVAGKLTVVHARGTAVDGTDTVSNMERLQFSDQTVSLITPAAPAAPTATAGNASATVTWAAPVANGSPAITSYEIVVSTGTTVVSTITGIPTTPTSRVVTGLTNGTSYTFQVRAVNEFGAGALSAASNAVTPAGDAAAPTVTARSPLAGATGVAVGANVTATFSENVTGVNAARFTLRQGAGVNGNLIARAVTYNAATRTATLNPNANLAANTLYTARLLAGITDTAGNPLAAVTWSFTTAAANAAPTVIARTPAANATGVSRVSNMTATFSEAVQGVSGTTVRLQRVSNGNFIGAAVAFNAATRVATLNPNVTLLANTQYRLVLTGGTAAIRDLANAPLVSTSWTFTTGP